MYCTKQKTLSDSLSLVKISAPIDHVAVEIFRFLIAHLLMGHPVLVGFVIYIDGRLFFSCDRFAIVLFSLAFSRRFCWYVWVFVFFLFVLGMFFDTTKSNEKDKTLGIINCLLPTRLSHTMIRFSRLNHWDDILVGTTGIVLEEQIVEKET